MNAMIWKIGSEDQIRAHVVAQDGKFQSVMRAYLDLPEPEKKEAAPLRLVAPAAVSERPRDVINVTANADLLRQPTRWKIILEEVCVKHQVTRSEILGPQRERRIVAARQEAMYRMKTETTLSLPQIGHRMGGKDHTTVLHGVRKFKAKLEAVGL